MARTEDGLKVVEPQPIVNETTPLLGDTSQQQDDSLEAQAAQERREHDATTVPIADEPSTGMLLATMSTLWFTSFFAALDNTVVATLAKPISEHFNSGPLFTWLATGYLITNAAFQPISGKLTDIYGRRAGLVFAVTFFAGGTLLCAVAEQAWVIILGRLIAGAGGGCINTISQFVASDLIPLRKRGVWGGIGNIVYGTGMGLGGVFGGLVNDSLGWRYAFYIQVPCILAAGTLSIAMVKVPVKVTEENRLRRVDFLGALSLVSALVLLVLGLSAGGNLVPWNHPLVYVSLPCSAVALALFVVVEDKFATEPIIPIRLLLNRSVAGACLTNWFETMSALSLLFFVPIYYQIVLHATASGAGLSLLPQAVGTATGSLGAGILMRLTGRYLLLNAVMQAASIAACAGILGTFGLTVAPAAPIILLLLGGMAYGAMLTITLISLIAAVDHKHQAVITSASYAFRSTGSVIGIALSTALLQNLLQNGLWRRFGSHPHAGETIQHIRDSLGDLKDVPASWQDGVVDAYVDALRGVWALALGFAVLAALSSFCMRHYKLYSNLERS